MAVGRNCIELLVSNIVKDNVNKLIMKTREVNFLNQVYSYIVSVSIIMSY
jgi:hypothetical protein